MPPTPYRMVRKERLELSRVTPLEPKSSASTNSATLAQITAIALCSAVNSVDDRHKAVKWSTVTGVNDGTRTHDDRNHNPGLYQLSYAHHIQSLCLTARSSHYKRILYGAPDRTRTCNLRLRRPLLYPVELRAQRIRLIMTRTSINWSG